jgi:hypothetical protein
MKIHFHDKQTWGIGSSSRIVKLASTIGFDWDGAQREFETGHAGLAEVKLLASVITIREETGKTNREGTPNEQGDAYPRHTFDGVLSLRSDELAHH